MEVTDRTTKDYMPKMLLNQIQPWLFYPIPQPMNAMPNLELQSVAVSIHHRWTVISFISRQTMDNTISAWYKSSDVSKIVPLTPSFTTSSTLLSDQ